MLQFNWFVRLLARNIAMSTMLAWNSSTRPELITHLRLTFRLPHFGQSRAIDHSKTKKPYGTRLLSDLGTTCTRQSSGR
jgi:hypothetical protein